MSDVERIVIVGASLAGAKAAETLRSEGFAGEVVLIGTEPELPYERPPLSKDVLLGKKEPVTAQVHDQQWYDDNNVDLRLGTTVSAIDPAGHTVTLPDGSTLGYDRLLLATGSRVRKLDVPGADLGGIRYLRTAAESASLLEALAVKPRVVVVGAGWIGLEVAAAAREHGCDVTVVEPQKTALAGVLGEQVGGYYMDLHKRHGVVFEFETGVEGFTGADGRVNGVQTAKGVVPADLVVVGVGVQPNVELAQAAGIEVATPDNGGGIVTGADLKTSAPDVYAAGDVVRWSHPSLGRPIRVEHWSNAKDSGAVAAKAMFGREVSHDSVPYFFTDMYDLGMEYVGDVPRGASYHVVVRGEPATNEYQAFWLDDADHVLAAMHVNVWDSTDALRKLVASDAPVDPAKLADPSISLDEL
ncbi:NAD(P)/FAD-dependent oxidoreductase [Kribbella deserti]|uniref:NAD(P)/FAD-dependent oxidoreductase n=1 Tax=Kribbella deserti TaxID=1926257 RepID=A0ABV6QDP8_9ACTN